MKPDKTLVLSSLQALTKSRQQAIFRLKGVRQKRATLSRVHIATLTSLQSMEDQCLSEISQLKGRLDWELRTNREALR